MPSKTILECRGVKKHYGALAAVDGIDLKIKEGETVGIGGPNGAGKTTFFDLISGLTAVTSGQVLFRDQPITGIAPHLLFQQGMARTFQVTSGFASLTVLENLLAAIIFGSGEERPGLFVRNQHRERAMRVLDECGLRDLSAHTVGDIPVLARKKLMVASAVVHDPSILLLDEPVGGLMPAEIDEFIQLMFKLRSKGICIVFIEHVMRFLTTVADRALIIHQGKLIYDGQPKGIAADELVRSVYLGSSASTLGGNAS
ncbi:branched-chain amino acid ABC transporter, ATP-binding protein (plasmid) [Aminobacter sp. Y103A]|uniref:ABC transporter ATP-binding protein n=1 Tax=Aminobacter sp. Y103A TaxID=1870862 RepID=UPI002572CDBC|nr:ATP-binding cassette domain-containing protein [Aminobacter sp. SS-2016]BBD41497.1 branched-chain amino acid ABC transporter, ATP-binding protein [Aminobacter sp. SS-2016]